jgi:hypothetical protein
LKLKSGFRLTPSSAQDVFLFLFFKNIFIVEGGIHCDNSE